MNAGERSVPEFSFDYFYNTVNAYYRTAALKAAIELGVFDAVGEQGKTVEAIATACRASVRGIRILCCFLVSIGLLKKEGERFFMTRAMSVHLARSSPGYLGESLRFLLSPYMVDSFKDLTSVIRDGRLHLPGDGVVAPDHPQWVEFARAMAPTMSLQSLLLAEVADPKRDRPIRVLDVGAGHGLFGIAMAQRNPQARVAFLDWDNVLSVARENAGRAGVLERAQFLPGSAFDVDVGTGYDVILMANFLHHFDKAGCEVILRRMHAALEDDGRLCILEFVTDESRTAPSIALTFSMMMLSTTPAGEAYAFSDLRKVCTNSGYAHVELKSIPPALEKVVVARKTAAWRN